jgi:hypothetical protein
MSLIVDTVLAYLPPKRKQTPSGWISFNAPCCDDRRQRGGFIVNGGDAISYHCFNCQFKASWQPGRPITAKMKELMKALHVPDDTITKLTFEALRLKEDGPAKMAALVPTFSPRALPLGAEPIASYLDNPPDQLLDVLEYLVSRNLYLEDYPFYWSEEPGFENRLIVPFFYRGTIVGYTARRISEGKPKYISEQQPGYVFNLDRQTNDRQFVIVTEGPFDAIAIDGIALLGAEIKAGQHLLINQLQREVILVPDRDKAGLETVTKMIDQGLNWSVSMPDWVEGIKDVNDAVKHYGCITTLWMIVNNKLSTDLKIKLKMKNWIKDEKTI